jgi:hypothetical protein
LSCKAVQNWVEKHGSRYTDKEVEMEVQKWLGIVKKTLRGRAHQGNWQLQFPRIVYSLS